MSLVSFFKIGWETGWTTWASSLCTTGSITVSLIVFVILCVEGWITVWFKLTASLWTIGTYSFFVIFWITVWTDGTT